MELIYAVRRKPLKCEPPHFERASDPEVVRPICTISCCNIIAFSSPMELTDTDGGTWAGHVYVCDLDTPWDSHKVVSTTHPISALEWDIEGKQLLVATTEGEVSVYGQKEYLLNDWTCLYSATFPGEHIIKAVFFHPGRRLLALDKKLDAPLAERVQALRPTPTLKGFGGVPIPGACAVSASGLVLALVPGPSSSPAPSSSASPSSPTPCTSTAAAATAQSLAAHRERVTKAAIAHKNGNLLIAGVCISRGGGAVVRCALCGVRGGGGGAGGGGAHTHAPAAVHIHTQPLPTLVCAHPANLPPTSITWCLREDTDSLAVGGAGATLTLWKLSERAHAVHKLLAKGPVQGNTTPGGGPKPVTDCFNTVVWQQTGAWCVEAGSVSSTGSGSSSSSSSSSSGAAWSAVCAARLPLLAPHVALAAHNKIHLLNRDSHHYICTRVISLPEPVAASPPKKSKYGNGNTSNTVCAIVSCLEFSLLGGVLVALDTHAQLHVFRLPQPWADIPTPMSVQHATSILEYSLVSGYDCLDILLTLKPNIVEAVYERVTESFQRQPAPFQQYYFHSWLKMRIALCRLVSMGASSVSWLCCLSALSGAWAALGAALRPLEERPDDKPLAALLDDHHQDHDKALVALEANLKPEFPPPELAALAALRRLLQRVIDIAITTLAAVSHNPHGYELWTDPMGLTLLRKLVVIARGAGLGDPAISRLLARLHHPLKQDLIEECGALAAQWAARVWEAPPRTAVSAAAPRAAAYYLEYGTPDERLHSAPPPPPALSAAQHHYMDSIRYMYLGVCVVWRGCGRCGARALAVAQPGRHPLQRAHDARYLPACRCGGKWTLVSNI